MSGAAFIDSHAHPSASPFYSWCGAEYINIGEYIGVTRVYECPHMTLPMLLERMAEKLLEGVNVIVTCHGTAKTLSLHLTPKSKIGIDVELVRRLLNPKIIGVDPATLTEADFKAYAKSLETNEAVARKLAKLLPLVHKKGIKHLAIRACNIGNHFDGRLMLALKDLFNAKSISAPRVRDAYAYFTPTIVNAKATAPAKALQMDANMMEPFPIPGQPPRAPNDMDRWLKKNPRATVYGIYPHRFAIATTFKGSGFTISGYADSIHAIQGWINAKFSPYIAPYQAKQKLYIHGLYDNIKLHYPREQGFRSNIRFLDKKPSPYGAFDPLEGLDLTGPMVF